MGKYAKSVGEMYDLPEPYNPKGPDLPPLQQVQRTSTPGPKGQIARIYPTSYPRNTHRTNSDSWATGAYDYQGVQTGLSG